LTPTSWETVSHSDQGIPIIKTNGMNSLPEKLFLILILIALLLFRFFEQEKHTMLIRTANTELIIVSKLCKQFIFQQILLKYQNMKP
jgi:hypothetical protein